MMQRLSIVATVAFWSCTTAPVTPEGVTIRCETQDQCPAELICNEVARLCEEPGAGATEFPALRVAFVNPVDGADGIPVNTTLVLAFSSNVDLDRIDEAVRLRRVGAEEVPLRRIQGDANTFQFELRDGALLRELSPYEVLVDAGLEAPLGESIRPLEEAFRSQFTTGVAPDNEAPGPVTGLVVDRGESIVSLRWTAPSDADFAGILIVRAVNQTVTGIPENRVAYETDQAVGDPSNIVIRRAIGTPGAAAGFDDLVSPNERYDYVVYAFDAANNYSAPTRAPFSNVEIYDWCPDQSSAFDAVLPAGRAATMRLWIAPDGGAPPALDAGAYFPATPTPVGSAPAIPLGTQMLLGETYWVRLELEEGGNIARTRPALFTVSDPMLATLSTLVTGVGLDWNIASGPWDWQAATIEAELNTAPGFPAGSWTTTGVSTSGQPARTVSLSYSGTNDFKARVRPRVAGCPAGAWTESEVFSTENVSFVDASVQVSDDGSTPEKAFKTISEALSLASAGQIIRVRGFEPASPDFEVYSEDLVPGFNVTLLGGYDATFTVQDRRQWVSRVQCVAGPTLLVDAGLTASTVVDGFELECANDAAVRISNGGPSIRNSVLRGGGPVMTALGSTDVAVFATGRNSVARIQGSEVSTDGSASQTAGLALEAGATLEARENLIRTGDEHETSVGIYFNSAGGVANGNSLFGGEATSEAHGVRVAGTSVPEIILANNVIAPGRGDIRSVGVLLQSTGNVVKITNNTISSGTSNAAGNPVIEAAELDRVAIVNNILFDTSNSLTSVGIRAPLYPFGGAIVHNTFVDIEKIVDLTGETSDIRLESGSFCREENTNSNGFCDPLSGMTETRDFGNSVVTAYDDAEFDPADPERPVLTAGSRQEERVGGVNAAAPSACGLFDDGSNTNGSSDGSCGDLTADREGIPRTCTTPTTACFSRGAYEFEPN